MAGKSPAGSLAEIQQQALAAFRERMTLDGNWTLLRGPESAVQDLAMLLGVKYKRDYQNQKSRSGRR